MFYDAQTLTHLAAVSIYADGYDAYSAIEAVAPLFGAVPVLRPDLWDAVRGHSMRRACFVAVVAALHAASAPGAPELFLRDWAALNAARGRNMFTGEVDDLGWGTPNPPAAVCAPHAL